MTSSHKDKLKILGIVIPLVFLSDQAAKWIIVSRLKIGESLPVIPGIFDIVHVRNRGAAFGAFSGLPEPVRLPFFLVVSLLALTLITIYFFRMNDPRKTTYVCLALILGGALGNIRDRLRLGEVVDFLSFHWYDKIVRFAFAGRVFRIRLEWPAFNVADAAITVAVAWLMILMLKDRKKEAS